MTTLEIRDLHVSVETEDGAKEILRGVDLTINSGETHAIMGPNGSGKSTLAYSIAGHPKYKVTGGTVTLDGEDVLAMKVDERARAGLFLAMQYPVEITGVTVSNFLRTAKTALDGEAPAIRGWIKDLRESMTERDVECILQRARELFPVARPRIVTDNGPQFIARDFKEFIRVAGMTHVRISPGYPQSNGKLERWHKTYKSSALRPAAPTTIDEARRVTADFVEHYNARRLHSSIGYIAPSDKLAGRETVIFAERDRKLEAARELRRQR